MFLVLYVVYCIGMAFNSHVEKWAQAFVPVPAMWKTTGQHGGVVLDAEANPNYKTMQANQEKLNGKLNPQ